MAKFSRGSTAYKQDGSVVATGVPRFESNGVMVEEGTVNLINPPIKAPCIGDGKAWSAPVIEWNEASNYRISGQIGRSGLMAFIVTSSNLTLSDIATITVNYKNSVNDKRKVIQLYDSNGTRLTSANFSGWSGWTWNMYYQGWFIETISVPFTLILPAGVRKIGFGCGYDSNNIGATTSIDFLQVEAKPYATTFHPSTRTAESLTIPASALSVNEGTIEFDVMPPYISDRRILVIADKLGGMIQIILSNGYVRAESLKYGSTIKSSGSLAVLSTSKNKIALIISNAGAVLYANGLTTPIVGYESIGSNISYINVGGRSASHFTNAYFSSLRISNKARSDAELANTSALSVDEFTTYFLPMNGNLGAQGQGVSVSSGNGATKQLRTGAGYRSVTAKAAVKSYILRTAKFYPQIIASADGKTTQSRVGSGYRTAVVQSSADVKLIEPGIEISTAVIERKGVTSVIERLSRTEVIGVPYIGDTVTLKAEFYTKGGVLADPVNISLKFFDSLKNQIGTTITIGSQHRISAGVYEYDYTVPSGYRNIFYEFAATQESTPQLIPGRIACKQRVDVGNWE